MTLDEFKASLAGDAPPGELSGPLKALWMDSRGDWEQAHRTVQNIDSDDAAWVHAYLHRKEGDRSNAAYWYRRAGRRQGTGSLDDEWRDIAEELLRR
jgi:hypothetical protein